MFRITWITDPHLDFVEEARIVALENELNASRPDAVLLGGDIGEAKSVVGFLRRLVENVDAPLYVVLGNHDYYGGGIQAVRNSILKLSEELDRLTYLTLSKTPTMLTSRVGLVGHDGWADAREGDYHRSLVMMNDYLLIEELAHVSKSDRLALLHELGDQAASVLRSQLAVALQQFPHVFVLTHVPPFRGACWYHGTISDDEWAPHFVCQAVGRLLQDLASLYPSRHITTLCGHTHHAGEYEPLPNLQVITGEAEYGFPRITRTFELP